MTKKICLETFKKCPRSLCFTLLIGIVYNYVEAKRKSEFVQQTLAKSGFTPAFKNLHGSHAKFLPD